MYTSDEVSEGIFQTGSGRRWRGEDEVGVSRHIDDVTTRISKLYLQPFESYSCKTVADAGCNRRPRRAVGVVSEVGRELSRVEGCLTDLWYRWQPPAVSRCRAARRSFKRLQLNDAVALMTRMRVCWTAADGWVLSRTYQGTCLSFCVTLGAVVWSQRVVKGSKRM